MINYLRSFVSYPKNRYIDREFNLDLSYICPRIISMSFPGSGIISLYRNSIYEVSRFLNERHNSNYLIFNLSSFSYDISLFNNQVITYEWIDHQAPKLCILFDICSRIKSYLNENIKNTVVIHCNAGKGRTGTVIICLLIFLGAFNSLEESMDYYSHKRFSFGDAVTQPGQIRYISYFLKLLNGNCSNNNYIQDINMNNTINNNYLKINSINLSNLSNSKVSNQVYFDKNNLNDLKEIKEENNHNNTQYKLGQKKSDDSSNTYFYDKSDDSESNIKQISFTYKLSLKNKNTNNFSFKNNFNSSNFNKCKSNSLNNKKLSLFNNTSGINTIKPKSNFYKIKYPFRRTLKSIKIKHVPLKEKQGYIKPIVEIYVDNTSKIVYSNKTSYLNQKKIYFNNDMQEISLLDKNLKLDIYGDVIIKLYNYEFLVIKKLAMLTFNTAFISKEQNFIKFYLYEIDPDSLSEKQYIDDRMYIILEFIDDCKCNNILSSIELCIKCRNILKSEIEVWNKINYIIEVS